MLLASAKKMKISSSDISRPDIFGLNSLFSMQKDSLIDGKKFKKYESIA